MGFYPFTVCKESAPNQNAIYEQPILQRILGQEVTNRGVVNAQVFIILEGKLYVCNYDASLPTCSKVVKSNMSMSKLLHRSIVQEGGVSKRAGYN